MKSAAFALVPCGKGELLIHLHSTSHITDEDWEIYLDLVRQAKLTLRNDLSQMKTFVVTDGGSPNTKQRAALGQILAGQVSRTAVMTDDRVTAGVITAISWFNAGIKRFASDNFEGVLRYLELEAYRQGLIAAVSKLRRDLGPVQALRAFPTGDGSTSSSRE
jgi:hypothetical protein